MDIKSSLAIENRELGKVNIIFSGSFAKVYNQSLYILTQIIGKPLKVQANYYKSANNRFVVSGGFPLHRVEKEFPHAVKTDWGYQITGEFDTKAYRSWLLRYESAAQAVENAATAVGTSCTRSSVQGVSTSCTAPTSPQVQKIDNHTITLTEQQVKYLLDWQKGDYPIEVDFGFINCIKQQLINNNHSAD